MALERFMERLEKRKTIILKEPIVKRLSLSRFLSFKLRPQEVSYEEKVLRDFGVTKFYKGPFERTCSDCKYYLDGFCTWRRIRTFPEAPAYGCVDFRFKDVVCSKCGKKITNYCPWGTYVRNVRELKRFGFDGMEFITSKGAVILCLNCWAEGVKKGILTYGKPPGVEEAGGVVSGS